MEMKASKQDKSEASKSPSRQERERRERGNVSMRESRNGSPLPSKESKIESILNQGLYNDKYYPVAKMRGKKSSLINANQRKSVHPSLNLSMLQ
jgi:hypothetical protein